MVDPMYPIRTRYLTSQGLSKTEMINICKVNVIYIYNPIYGRVQLNHLILKENIQMNLMNL